VAEVGNQGHRRDEKVRQSGKEGEPIQRLDLLYVEHLHQGGEYERPGDDPCDIGIDDDQQALVDLDLVRVDVPLDLGKEVL